MSIVWLFWSFIRLPIFTNRNFLRNRFNCEDHDDRYQFQRLRTMRARKMPYLILASQGIVKMVRRFPLFTFPVLFLILVGTGCSMVPKSETPAAYDQANVPPNEPMILVEMQSKETGGSTQRIPLAKAPTLQAAVDQANATAKYKRFHIAVSRLPEQPGRPPQKLISQYDHVEKMVPFEYDYQLKSGDRVVIVEDPRNSMNDLFGGLIGPLRMAAGGEPLDKSPF